MYKKYGYALCMLVSMGAASAHTGIRSLFAYPEIIKASSDVKIALDTLNAATKKTSESPYKEYAAQNQRDGLMFSLEQENDELMAIYREAARACAVVLRDLQHSDYLVLKDMTIKQLCERESIQAFVQANEKLIALCAEQYARFQKQYTDPRAQAFYEVNAATLALINSVRTFVQTVHNVTGTRTIGEFATQEQFEMIRTKIVPYVKLGAEFFEMIENSFSQATKNEHAAVRKELATFDRMAAEKASCAELNRQALIAFVARLQEMVPTLDESTQKTTSPEIKKGIEKANQIFDTTNHVLHDNEWFAQMPAEVKENLQLLTQALASGIITAYTPQLTS